MDKYKIGSNIIKYRKQCSLSQYELAGLLNISNGTMSNYETDKTMPGIETMIRICDILNIDPNTLFGYQTNNDLLDKYNKASKDIKQLVNRLLDI